ncbi:glycosyltransferase family 1 protein [Flagelloscypha sp. PMI_526]|nr:glycosyltransferase family 1 protein [Flagelloscypha sp. PMI_526]
MSLFTVGSTQFDELVKIAVSQSTLDTLHQCGYTSVTVQAGASKVPPHESTLQMQVDAWGLKPSMKEEYEKADLIVSHGGAGTILEVLRLNKPLIVVPNPTLLDNHQEDLASALSELGHLFVASPSTLNSVIALSCTQRLKPFPPQNPSLFSRILDQEMGFI